MYARLIAGQSGAEITRLGMDGHRSASSCHEVGKVLTLTGARTLPRGNLSYEVAVFKRQPDPWCNGGRRAPNL